MCQSSQITHHEEKIIYFHLIYLGKFLLETVVFIFVFIQSGIIEKANKELDFREQFFIILLLNASVVFARLLFFIIDPTWNVALILHSIDCLSNLLCGMFLMRTYVGDGNYREYYLPTYSPITFSDLEYLLSKTDSRSAILGYFCRE